MREREEALRHIFLAAQEVVTFPDSTLSSLAVVRDADAGGRLQFFNHNETVMRPHKSWISTLLAQEAHNADHEEMAGTPLWMRKKAWVIKGWRVGQKVVDGCVTWRKTKVENASRSW